MQVWNEGVITSALGLIRLPKILLFVLMLLFLAAVRSLCDITDVPRARSIKAVMTNMEEVLTTAAACIGIGRVEEVTTITPIVS